MTRQIMKLNVPHNDTWKVIMDDSDKFNQFRVYRETNGHKKLMEKYGDIASCLHFITQQMTGHVWYMSDQKVERAY